VDNTPVMTGVAAPVVTATDRRLDRGPARTVSAILMDILARTDRAAVTAAGAAATEEADVKAHRP